MMMRSSCLPRESAHTINTRGAVAIFQRIFPPTKIVLIGHLVVYAQARLSPCGFTKAMTIEQKRRPNFARCLVAVVAALGLCQRAGFVRVVAVGFHGRFHIAILSLLPSSARP